MGKSFDYRAHKTVVRLMWESIRNGKVDMNAIDKLVHIYNEYYLDMDAGEIATIENHLLTLGVYKVDKNGYQTGVILTPPRTGMIPNGDTHLNRKST